MHFNLFFCQLMAAKLPLDGWAESHRHVPSTLRYLAMIESSEFNYIFFRLKWNKKLHIVRLLSITVLKIYLNYYLAKETLLAYERIRRNFNVMRGLLKW